MKAQQQRAIAQQKRATLQQMALKLAVPNTWEFLAALRQIIIFYTNQNNSKDHEKPEKKNKAKLKHTKKRLKTITTLKVWPRTANLSHPRTLTRDLEREIRSLGRHILPD